MRLSKIVGILLITAFVFTVGQANASPPSIEKKEQASFNIAKEVLPTTVISFEPNSLQEIAVESNIIVKEYSEKSTELVSTVLVKNYYISPHYLRWCDNSISYVQNANKKLKSDNPHLEAPEIIDKNYLAITPSS